MVASVVAALAATLAPAQYSIREVWVHFSKGASGTTIKEGTTGDEMIYYKLAASAGRRVTVTLHTDNASNYFNLIAPGAGNVAFYNSFTSANVSRATSPRAAIKPSTST
jgi:hypothetical protein